MNLSVKFVQIMVFGGKVGSPLGGGLIFTKEYTEIIFENLLLKNIFLEKL